MQCEDEISNYRFLDLSCTYAIPSIPSPCNPTVPRFLSIHRIVLLCLSGHVLHWVWWKF